MLAESIWILCLVSELILLLRARTKGLFRYYPLFFAYLSFVFVQSLFRHAIAGYWPSAYGSVYWLTEFLGVLIGCGVVLEICRLGLAFFPGAAAVGRNALLISFLLTVGKLFVRPGITGGWTPMHIIELERDMRFVQIAALLAIVLLFTVYSIPISRNLRGIIVGYGLYIGLSVLNFTFLSYFGESVQVLAVRLQASAYLLALLIWTPTLWRYVPAPGAAVKTPTCTYQSILSETETRLAQERAALNSAVGS